MTTFIAFAPSTNGTPPFQTVVTLDGAAYSLVCVWNVYRQEWYYSLTDQPQNVVSFMPLVGSPPNADIYLAPGIFTTSTILFRIGTGNFEVNP